VKLYCVGFEFCWSCFYWTCVHSLLSYCVAAAFCCICWSCVVLELEFHFLLVFFMKLFCWLHFVGIVFWWSVLYLVGVIFV